MLASVMVAAAAKAAQTAATANLKKNISSCSRSSSSSSSSQKNTAAFDKDFDYANAIANTTDAAERARLLAARQAKIDALGLEGKVGSNDAVATWLGDYRPYQVASSKTPENQVQQIPTAPRIDITGLYDAAAKARLQAFETAKQQIAQQLQTQYTDIDAAYQQGMTQIDVNARRSALGNAEKLAALGLSSGSAYAAPTSGYTETSRIAVDNAYRGDLNGLAQARLAARSSAAQAAADRETNLSMGFQQSESSAALQQAQAQAQMQLSQYQADRDYSISLAGLTGFLNGIPTLAYQQMLSANNQWQTENNQQQAQIAWQNAWQKEKFAQQQAASLANSQASLQSANEKAAYERALGRWKTYGYVLPEDASILGVAAGTPTSDQSYRSAQLHLNQIKTNYQISK